MEDMEDLTEFDNYSGYDSRENVRRIRPAKPTHSTAPLLLYPQKLVLDSFLTENFNHSRQLQRIPVVREGRNLIIGLCINPGSVSLDYGRYSSYLLSLSYLEGLTEESSPLNKIWTAMSAAIKEEAAGLEFSQPAIRGKIDYLKHLNDMDISSIRYAYWVRACLTEVRDRIQSETVRCVEIQTKTMKVGMIVINYLSDMFVLTGLQEPCILTYDHFLAILDTYSARVHALTAALLGEYLHMTHMPSYRTLVDFYKWGDKLSAQYGHKSMAVLCELEAIVTAALLCRPGKDPLDLGRNYSDCVLKSCRDKCREEEMDPSHPDNLFSWLITLAPTVLSELFGLRKHFGLPIVDADVSSQAMVDVVTANLPISGSNLELGLATYNHMFVTEFIKREQRWPEGRFPDGDRSYVAEAWRKRRLVINEYHANYNKLQWANFRFLKNVEVDPEVHYLDLLGDKSVSLYLEHADEFFHPMLRYQHRQSGGQGKALEQRRALLEYLRKTPLSIMDIYRIVMTNHVPDSWKINNITLKGTEMKYLKGRLFAVFCLPLRQYFVATESLIKRHILKYNPHQTMDKGEKEIEHMLLKLTQTLTTQGSKHYLNVLMVVDFKKWNLHFRRANTDPYFQAMDDYLGTPGLIANTHIIFRSLTNVLGSLWLPPDDCIDSTEGSRTHRLQGTGNEGQRQKGWLIPTTCMLRHCCEKSGFQFELIGQGDNQIIRIMIPVPSNYTDSEQWVNDNPEMIKEMINSFSNNVFEFCESLGSPLKRSETLLSTIFSNYGKRLFYDGVELPMVLKNIGKVVGVESGLMPTLSNSLATALSSSAASCQHDVNQVLSTVIGKLEAIFQVRNSFVSHYLNQNEGLGLIQKHCGPEGTISLTDIMTIPAAIGGPACASLTELAFRGHPDPLAAEFCRLVSSANSGHIFSQKLVTLIQSEKLFEPKVNVTNLLSNPYSLNIKLPRELGTLIGSHVETAIRSYCRNKNFSLVLDACPVDEGSRIEATLWSMTPFMPTLCAEIMAKTNPGTLSSLVQGISNATSLSRLLTEQRDQPWFSKIQRLDLQLMEHWIVTVLAAKEMDVANYTHVSSSQLLDWARKTSWGRRDMIGTTVPHPLSQFVLCETDSGLCSTQCTEFQAERISLTIDPKMKFMINQGERTLWFSTGYYPPLTGSSVNQNIGFRSAKLETRSKPVSAAVKLAEIRRWVAQPRGHLESFLDQIIATRTDLSIDTIYALAGHPTRASYIHRMMLAFVKDSCASNQLTNFLSFLYFSSNEMGKYSHGPVNYALAYTPAFLAAGSLLSLIEPSMDHSVDRPKLTYHFHVRHDDVPTVYDDKLDLVRDPQISLTQPKTARMIFASEQSTTIIPIGHLASFDTDIKPPQSRRVTIQAAATQLAHEILKPLIRRTIVSTVSLKTDHTVPIGELRAIGVKNCLDAIACQLLFLVPWSILVQCRRSSLDQLMTGYLASIDLTCLNDLCYKLTMKQFRSQLHQMGFVFLDFRIVSSWLAMKQPLIDYLAKQSCRLWDELETCDTFYMSSTSHQSRCHLYELWFNLVLGQLFREGFPVKKIRMEIRKAIRSCPESETGPIWTHLITAIHKKITDTCRPWQATPKFIHSFTPWYNELRKFAYVLPTPDNNALMSPGLDVPILPTEFYTCIEVELALAHQCISQPDESPLVIDSFREETYFFQSGALSKSHIPYIEIVSSLGLNTANQICLGSSTGSEALFFSKLRNVDKVYVCNLEQLTQFDKHIAIDYVPPAFVGSPYAEKLVNPSLTVLSDCNIASQDGRKNILKHTEEMGKCNITCDAEAATMTQQQQLDIILGVMHLSVDRVGSNNWVICKVIAHTGPNLSLFASTCKLFFEDVKIIVPLSSNKSILSFYLLCQNKCITAPLNLTVRCPTATFLYRCLSAIDNRISSKILGAHNPQQLHRIDRIGRVTNGIGPQCLKRYMFSYPHEDIDLNKLRCHKKCMLNILTQFIHANFRDIHGDSMVPGDVLMLKRNTKLHTLIEVFVRADFNTHILITILSRRMHSVTEITQFIKSQLRKDYRVWLHNRAYVLKIDSQDWIRKNSRHLFECLGHLGAFIQFDI